MKKKINDKKSNDEFKKQNEKKAISNDALKNDDLEKVSGGSWWSSDAQSDANQFTTPSQLAMALTKNGAGTMPGFVENGSDFSNDLNNRVKGLNKKKHAEFLKDYAKDNELTPSEADEWEITQNN